MRIVSALRVVLPAVWMGLILGLSFLETPLKFQAPGITVPLGLGIGRLVFIALGIAGLVLLIALTVLALLPERENRSGWMLLGGLWAVLAVQSLVVRPLLAARSDVIIAGGDPGPSMLHYGYIAADILILALLLMLTVHGWRRAMAQAAAR